MIIYCNIHTIFNVFWTLSYVNSHERQTLALEGCTFHTYLPTYLPTNSTTTRILRLCNPVSLTENEPILQYILSLFMAHKSSVSLGLAQAHSVQLMTARARIILVVVLYLWLLLQATNLPGWSQWASARHPAPTKPSTDWFWKEKRHQLTWRWTLLIGSRWGYL